MPRTSIVFPAVATALLVSGCAKNAADITASYVSPTLYSRLTCEELGQEARTVSNRAFMLAGLQNQQANMDAMNMTVGLLVAWPTLLFIKGNDERTGEIAHLRGEIDTIQQVSDQKKCGIKVEQLPPPKKPFVAPNPPGAF